MRHQTDLLPFPAPASPLLHCRDHLRWRARHVRKSEVYTLRDHQRLHACCIGRRRNTCHPGCCPSSEGISAFSISRTSDPTSRANSPPVWTGGIEKQGRVKPSATLWRQTVGRGNPTRGLMITPKHMKGGGGAGGPEEPKDPR